jgi:hypothetical protein
MAGGIYCSPRLRRHSETRKASSLVAATVEWLLSSVELLLRPRRIARVLTKSGVAVLIGCANRGMEWAVQRARYHS